MKTALRLNEAPLFYFKIKGMVELRTANNGNFLRRVDFGFNRTVGTLHMLYSQLTVGRCDAALNVIQMSEVRGDLDFGASFALDLNTQNVFRQESDGARGPAVAKAVAVTDIAVFAEIPVDILFRSAADFIQTARIFRPSDIKILPERGRAEVKHSAVIGFQCLQNFFGGAALRHTFQNVIAHEGGEAVCAAVLQTVCGVFFCDIGKKQKGSDLLEVAAVLFFAFSKRFDGLAFICKLRFSENAANADASIQTEDQKRLGACFCGRKSLGGPVDEIACRKISVFVYVFKNLTRQTDDVLFLFCEIFPFARIEYPFVEIDEPPEGVGGNAVDPSGQSRIMCRQRKRAVDLRNVPEDIFGRFHFGCKISDPNETISLDTVPDLVLQAEMTGIRRRVVNTVQSFVIGFEASDIFIGLIGHDRLNRLDIDLSGRQAFDIDETEARCAAFSDRPAFRADLEITHTVVVGRAFFSDMGKGFACGFTEGDAERYFLSVAYAEEGKANAAVQLYAEVEQDARFFFLGGNESRDLGFLGADLVVFVTQKAFFPFPDPTCQQDFLWNEIFSDTGIRVVEGNVFEHIITS